MYPHQGKAHSLSTPFALHSKTRLLSGHNLFNGLFSVLLVLGCATFASAQVGPPSGTVATNYEGIMYSAPTFDIDGPYIDTTVDRLWDDGVSWAMLEPQKGTWSSSGFMALDTILADDYTEGTGQAWVTLGGHNPQWAQSATTITCPPNVNVSGCDPNCDYVTGGCYPPYDLNADGSGTDATWKAWVTKIAQHVNGLDGNSNYFAPACVTAHTTCHAHVHFYDIWNEVDVTGGDTNSSDPNYDKYNDRGGYLSTDSVSSGVFFIGSYAQLVRMTEDAACIILGAGSTVGVTRVIHNDTTVGQTVTCANTAIDSNAAIVMPSSHSYTDFGTIVAQNFLYCDGASLVGSGNVTTGFPEYCSAPNTGSYTTGWYGAGAVAAINFHMKPGNATPAGTGKLGSGFNGFAVEDEMGAEYCAVIGFGNGSVCNASTWSYLPGILKTKELGKPFYNGEAGYSGRGWNGSPKGQSADLVANFDYQASFTSRYLLWMWSLGIQNFEWYQYDTNGNGGTASILASGTGTTQTLTEAGYAYLQTASWMNGKQLTAACGLLSGYTTTYICPFRAGTTKTALVWEADAGTGIGGTGTGESGTGYPCTNGVNGDNGSSCSEHNVTVPTTYTKYCTMWNAVTCANITAHTVPATVIPMLLK
jgi:hypothetical protein